MLICSVLFIGLLGGFANAQQIVCRYQDAAACSATQVDDIPWSSNGRTPAPKPECMDGYGVYDAAYEYEYGQPDSFSIKWMQKWVDIDDINGYFITTASSSGTVDYYILTLDREKLLQYYRNEKTAFATFNFTVDGFRNGAIVLYALPYAIDSTEYYPALQIEYENVVSKDSCPSNELTQCEQNAGGKCHPNAKCGKRAGKWQCKCKKPYSGDGFTCSECGDKEKWRRCVKVNPATCYRRPGTGGCHQTNKCDCRSGFVYRSDTDKTCIRRRRCPDDCAPIPYSGDKDDHTN